MLVWGMDAGVWGVLVCEGVLVWGVDASIRAGVAAARDVCGDWGGALVPANVVCWSGELASSSRWKGEGLQPTRQRLSLGVWLVPRPMRSASDSRLPPYMVCINAAHLELPAASHGTPGAACRCSH
eukprot:353785-Chlamydomonas_euryale.AAC.2